MVTKLHYSLVEEYKKQQYKGLLTSSNVTSDKIHINKVTFPGGETNDNYDFWGYTLEKDKTKYLLSSIDDKGKEVMLKELLPIFPSPEDEEGLEDVAHRGQAYRLINKPVPARISPERKMSFRQLVDTLSSSSHTNKRHQILNTIITLIQRIYRANVRICTPPGFGKDSMIVILDNIIGGCGSVTNPTVAKLEYMTYLNHLVINEVSSIRKSEWDVIQQFLLDTGDFKPSTFKRSRGVKEIIDLSKLSLSLFFNDISTYANTSKFFDNKTDDNAKDRYLPLRLHGRYDESFEEITTVDVKAFIKDNFSFYKDIASSTFYYIEQLNNEQKRFVVPDLTKYPERWRNNLAWILKGLNVYSDTEEEYIMWFGVVRNAIKDYDDMLKFPEHFIVLMNKLGIPSSVYGKSYNVDFAINYLLARGKNSNGSGKESIAHKVTYLRKVKDESLFANRNVMCSCYSDVVHSKEVTRW